MMSSMEKGRHVLDHDVNHHEATMSDTSLHILKRRTTRIANPSPAGIFAFASTTYVINMYRIHAGGVHNPNIILGMAAFTGGLSQFVAGMWQFPRGDVFSATVFSTYGTFWMAYALIHMPTLNVMGSFTDEVELGYALGILTSVWAIITLLFLLAVLRRNLSFVLCLSSLLVNLILLSAGEMTRIYSLERAASVFGLITSAIAFYAGFSELLEAEAKPILKLPRGEWYTNEMV